MSGIDADVARALLAGWLAGAALGLADTALLLIALSRTPSWHTRLPGLRVGLPALGVVAVNAMLIGWTLVGLVLGALYLATPMPAFAIAVATAWLSLAALYAFIRGLARRGEAQMVLATCALAALAFGGLLPTLAG